MSGFNEGYDFFSKNFGTVASAYAGEAYVNNINAEIDNLSNNLNSFQGFNTNSNILKGDIAEFWHSGTFNIDAALKGSKNRTSVDRSHDFASSDVNSNFGKIFGLKYYKDGASSAKEQAVSVFQRYKEYTAGGGKDSIEEFLAKRGFKNLDVLNDPIYMGQIRIIPKDQMEAAIDWLERKIASESVKRPDQVQRYKDTLKLLSDRLRDGKGNESIPLSADEAKRLAELAKQGNIDLKDLGLTTEDLVKYEYVIQQAMKAGMTSALISMTLRVVPEIFKAIEYLIKTGQIQEKQFEKLGFEAIQGAAEGFVRGSVSAAITVACKAGLWGEALKEINPSVVGVITVIAIDTMKNSVNVILGKMTKRELANNLIEEMFISSCSLLAGGITQVMCGLPVFGFMVGSFIGSMIGGFAYNCGQKAILSFCIDTGFTMFGLVDQDYKLPEEIMREIGLSVFDYEKFEYPKFAYEEFQHDYFEAEKFQHTTIKISFLRRGVIGVSQIGYVG